MTNNNAPAGSGASVALLALIILLAGVLMFGKESKCETTVNGYVHYGQC